MKYLSICSGIEAASVAWGALGWEAVGFSEIEAFPSAVLRHHYPAVPNLGDMTKYQEWEIERPDVLVGGTPCQSFSVAGLRKGLADPRGNLALVYCGIIDRFRPKWFVWENVPGVLSSGGGRDFGSFLGAVAELGYGFAYRVLDAQFFGVPQRRRRVFVVGYLGDWRPAAAVLFERESLRRDTAPRREAGQSVAPTVGTGAPFSRTGNGSEADALQPYAVANCLTARMHKGINSTLDEGQTPVVQAIAIQDVTPREKAQNGKGWNDDGAAYTVDTHATQGVAHPIAFNARQDPHSWADRTEPLDTHGGTQAVAFAQNTRDEVRLVGGDGQLVGALAAQPGMKQTTYVAQAVVAPTITATNDPSRSPQSSEVTQQVWAVMQPAVAFQSVDHAADASVELSPIMRAHDPMAVMAAMQVRRLTPVECERLQGFPDGYTNIPWRGKSESPDGPRYKALGNSMAVPVMRWIGERITTASIRARGKA